MFREPPSVRLRRGKRCLTLASVGYPTRLEGSFSFSILSPLAFRAGIASFLQISDAAFFNLSLLTGDAWAVAFSVFAEGIVPSYSFYAALAVTLSGVVVYETAPSPVVATTPSASGGAPPPEPAAGGAARSAVGGREPGTQEGLVIA